MSGGTIARAVMSGASTPGEILVDRSSEATHVANHILGAKSRFVVLHGPTDSGKSNLLRHDVRPLLQARGRVVYFGTCKSAFPTKLQGDESIETMGGALLREDAVIVIDDFETILDLPRGEKLAALENAFEQLDVPDARATVVLVADTRQLNGIYSLASYDQRATSAVYELAATSIDEAVRRLQRADQNGGVVCSEEFLAALQQDCDQATMAPIRVDGSESRRGQSGDSQGRARAEWLATFDLARLVHDRCVAWVSGSPGSREVDVGAYISMGRVQGILRTELDRQLDVLAAGNPSDAAVARSILEHMLMSLRQGDSMDLAVLAPRIGTALPEVEHVLQAGIAIGLLRRKSSGELRASPEQLLSVVEEDLATREPKIEQARRIVVEGARDWVHHGTLLPQQRFASAHAERQYLVVDNEKARFLFQCALVNERVPDGAAEYWIGRVDSREDVLNALLLALIHDVPQVRARASTLLAAYPDDDIRERLCAAALLDPSPEARASATRSLEQMKTPALHQRLLGEARAVGGRTRGPAIEALRLFPSAETVALLADVVAARDTDLALRESAVRVLSRLESAESVDTLIAIALDDEDASDRAMAAQGLAEVRDVGMIGRIFDKLQSARRSHAPTLAIALVGIGTFMAMVVGAVVIAAAAQVSARVLLGVVMIAAPLSAWLLRVLMKPLVSGTKPAWSVRGVVAMLWFALNAMLLVPLVHGLAHFGAGAKRRAGILLGLEALGLVFFYEVAPVLNAVPLFSRGAMVYEVLGLLLFVGTYLYDVFFALINETLFPRARAREVHRCAVYDALFATPRATTHVLESLGPGTGGVAGAEQLLGRHAEHIEATQLVAMLSSKYWKVRRIASRVLTHTGSQDAVRVVDEAWTRATPAARTRLAPVLMANTVAHSLGMASKVSGAMPMRERLVAHIASSWKRISARPLVVTTIALALLPAVVALLYSGVELVKNPAFGPITMLRREELSGLSRTWAMGAPTDEERTKLIRFLADAYPDRSADALYDLLTTKHALSFEVRAALAEAVAGLNDDAPARRPGMLAAVAEFDSSLASGSESQFDGAREVLGAAALSADSVVATAASNALVGYVRRSALEIDSPLADRATRVVSELGKLPAERALRTLDTLVSPGRDGGAIRNHSVYEALLTQINTVSHNAAALVSDPDSVAGRGALLGTLKALKNPPGAVIATLTKAIASDDSTRAGCASSDPKPCQLRAAALRNIEQNPSLESGYRDLLNHFVDAGKYDSTAYDKAALQFRALTAKSPTLVWPRKILAELLHEYIAPNDPSAFGTSFAEMRELRREPAYQELERSDHDTYVRLEGDYAEIALSAGQVAETDSLARYFRATHAATIYQLNGVLFAYLGHLVAGDPVGARQWLSTLQTVVDALPRDFTNDWLYPGTTAFLQKAAMPESARRAALALLQRGNWYVSPEAKRVLEQNRAAVAQLTQAAPR